MPETLESIVDNYNARSRARLEGLLEYQSQFENAEPGTAESLQYERIDRKIQNLIKPEWSEADRRSSQENTLKNLSLIHI